MGNVSINKDDREPTRAYMVGVQWLYEVDPGALVRNYIYPSIEAYYAHDPCGVHGNLSWPQDGIVEIEMRFIRHIPAEECWEHYQKDKE